jgi:hypothetical protein
MRDRVYAIFGLLKTKYSNEIVLDYTISTQELNRDVYSACSNRRKLHQVYKMSPPFPLLKVSLSDRKGRAVGLKYVLGGIQRVAVVSN